MQKITTFLWFDNEAEEAASFYRSIFPDSRITAVSHYGEAGPGKEGSVMALTLELFDQEFTFLNGGPGHPFTDAISLMVNCDTQEEVDRYWSALTAGGEEVACGWLKDKYGLFWQITPRALMRMLEDRDRERANRVMQAMLQMKKLDIKTLERAYATPSAPLRAGGN
jgi:predicted 3-demethylubiquinone-9 3-methyltransferase (glyoxalase superfamily)